MRRNKYRLTNVIRGTKRKSEDQEIVDDDEENVPEYHNDDDDDDEKENRHRRNGRLADGDYGLQKKLPSFQ